MEIALNIPPCAMVVDPRTVLVRIRTGSGAAEGHRRNSTGAAERLNRISGCDCSRISEVYSGCDSVVVGRCRPFRSRSTWRRYVNVSAAVCLLLLVAGLTPRSAAAPPASRSTKNMDRKQWENPCDYNCVTQDPTTSYEPEMARRVVNQAQNAKAEAESYRDEFAKKTHSYDSFEKLVNRWQSYEWLRNFAWVKETQQSFPAAKVYGQNVSDAVIQEFVQESKINSVLPAMYKNLQMIVASFSAMPDALSEPPELNELIPNITHTRQQLKSVLCDLFDVLSTRGLQPETITIDLEDIPNFTNSAQEKYELLLLVYRDTLSYLEYVQQVFQAMSEMKN